MITPSDQLYQEHRAALTQALSSRRPVIHHLNADTSWLLQIARPQYSESSSDRRYYNVLLDPWLSGSQSDVASWFSTQEHASQSRVGSIDAVNMLIHNIESLASGTLDSNRGRRSQADTANAIDVVVVSHEFTDHCHKETLLELGTTIPIIATAKAAKIIRSWSHFRHVYETPTFGAASNGRTANWEATAFSPLPPWLGISRLVSANDKLDYHSAIMLAFNTSGAVERDEPVKDAIDHREHERFMAEEAAEAVIYTPHGISDTALGFIAEAEPPIRALALLHGLDDISLAGRQQLNLGGHNGLKVQRVLKAKYWISTHDEKKVGTGLVGWLLNRKTVSIKDALASEQSAERDDGLQLIHEPYWMDLKNGESRILH